MAKGRKSLTEAADKELKSAFNSKNKSGFHFHPLYRKHCPFQVFLWDIIQWFEVKVTQVNQL